MLVQGQYNRRQKCRRCSSNTNAACDHIEDCHVDAVIVVKKTIGGVVSSSNHGVIRCYHVQSSIEAAEAPMWSGGPSNRGLIGQLATDWSENKRELHQPKFLNRFHTVDEPSFDGQYDTFQRAVGASCANEEPVPIYDDE